MNMQAMLKQAKKLQKQMEEEQEAINLQVFTASAGGVVTVEVYGTKLVKQITIDEAILNPEDKNEVAELISLAINNAQKEIDAKTNEVMSKYNPGNSGGLF